MKLVFVGGIHQISMIEHCTNDVDLVCIQFANRDMDDVCDEILNVKDVDLCIFALTDEESIERINNRLFEYKKDHKILFYSRNPLVERYSTVEPRIISNVHSYFLSSGIENYRRLCIYLKHEFCGIEIDVLPPVKLPWQGIVDYTEPEHIYPDLDSYVSAHSLKDCPRVAQIQGRENWFSDDYQISKRIAEEMTIRGMQVLTIVSKPKGDRSVGALNPATTLYRMLFREGKPLFDALIIGSIQFGDVYDDDWNIIMDETSFMRMMNVPIYCPVITSKMTESEWMETDGLGSKLSSYVILPEMKGFIEPFMLGTSLDEDGKNIQKPIGSRCVRFADRVFKRIMLRKKPNSEKKIIFLLNIGACASLESTLGLASSLDTYGSLHDIMARLRDEGYDIVVPADGEAIVKEILQKKSYCEFRWTDKKDIDASGGVAYHMSKDEYMDYYNRLSAKIRSDVEKTWGPPPGIGMVIDDEILITGIKYGNALVAVQPKRGCDAAGCDGQICKMIKNPNCPPTHHYLATYFYFKNIWKADMIIQMGSHGTMEYLPGKSVALSDDCYPDICIGDLPLFYIFSTTDSSSGTIAKRRGYATLIDHMQSPAKKYEAYGTVGMIKDLLSVEECDYRQLRELLDNFSGNYDEYPDEEIKELAKKIVRCYESSTYECGAHCFGRKLTKEEAISIVTRVIEQDIEYGRFGPIDDIEGMVSNIVSKFDNSCNELNDRVLEIYKRIISTDEMGSLINAMSGGFTDPGPSGLISRGQDEIFPTGRNFYSLNPEKLPSRDAWMKGTELALASVDKYLREEGKYPEEVAISWLSTDLTMFGGELMAHVMNLIGIEPIWSSSGKVQSFKIVPLDKMNHPRIDVAVRVTGSISSYFRSRIDLLDEAITEIAKLDEPLNKNYIAKHVHETVSNGVDFTEASSRLFGCAPNGNSGISYMISSGAWKDDSDLVKLYINNNCYFYGKGKNAVAMKGQFAENMARISFTFNRIAADERDLLVSTAYSVSQGGMSLMHEYLTKEKTKSYYGDTRSASDIQVRSLEEEVDRIANVKLFNPDWIEAMIKNGYKGGSALAQSVYSLYVWQASGRCVGKHIFDGIAEKYIFDKKVSEFLRKNNLFALNTIENRLIEAYGRGLWKADDNTIEKLKEKFLENEADMEGISDSSDIQGNDIEPSKCSDDPEFLSKLNIGLDEACKRVAQNCTKE